MTDVANPPHSPPISGSPPQPSDEPHAVEKIPAGDFATWLQSMTASLRGESGNDVPCGECVGCCSSSWPVALRARDEQVIAKIPPQWIVDPPHAPAGLRYMAYRSDGTCPMLTRGGCSVYAQRPQTCRDFDCRLFAAAGILSAGDDKPLINARIAAWRFTYQTATDKTIHEAIRSTARFLRAASAEPNTPRLPTSPIAIAGLAFKAHAVFLEEGHASLSPTALLARVIEAARAFDQRHEA